MNNSIDRQGILDNLTAIETTAKLLVNAFVKKNNDTELYLNGIHREELVTQTTTFLAQAQKLILNLSNTFNLTTDDFFQKSSKENLTESNEQFTSTSFISDVSQNNEDEKTDSKSSTSKKTYSLSSVTLDDIIQNRLTPKHLLPNYPLLHDSIQPNLISLIRNLRSIENFDNLMFKAYSKIFNQEERICCNYNGINGKLPYPRHKRLLLDFIIKLIFNERNKILDDNQRYDLYIECEKHFSTDTSLTKYRGLNIDHLYKNNRFNDEKQFICSIFHLIIPKDDIKRIITAKQDLSSEWNDNEICIYYARPIHLLWIKQKWLERYSINKKNEAEKWSQCIDWAIDSFLEKTKTRPSKRKTKDISMDYKRTKTLLTFEEKYKQLDRTKYNVLEYATQFLHLISDENNKNLPTLKQLQLLEHDIFHFYWTSNKQKTWSDIIDIISKIFLNELNDNFLYIYSKDLLEMNNNDQYEIERLLQIKL
ncbi:unnamed protein product [Rotaria sordida]|uniref:Uncharacterized protein n=1 Tax=Rotaria sordida TaxID=392033 RepID=A0A814D419_9BILA|nr:unnamed protein product [Rotaria sordida]CAF0950771.1 unnamed protein product [Rotaria sordida]CAF0977079.1 unnamed protein product [Rotaria sordida]CAF3757600.1 unnamed protein product [Rotaria sordida]